MRKFIFSLAAVCTVAGVAFLGGCHKECDSCKDKGDKPMTKLDAQATPASSSGCSSKCSGKCTGDKSKCPMTGQSN